MPFTATQIAEQLKGEVIGDGSTPITGFAPADCARAGDLTFAEKETHFAAAEQSQAAAILVSGPFSSATKVLIRVRDAGLPWPAYCRSSSLRSSRRQAFTPARSSTLQLKSIPRRTSGRIA
jgi:UDP-3-O-[3-hydroxymyristoyl] glucosamine N-acyltransferase